jgi:hypothetical protein
LNLDQVNKLRHHLQACIEILNEAGSASDQIALIREELNRFAFRDEAYTLKEVSRITKMSEATVHRYKNDGRLKVKKPDNGPAIVLRDDLIDFLKGLK